MNFEQYNLNFTERMTFESENFSDKEREEKHRIEYMNSFIKNTDLFSEDDLQMVLMMKG